MNCEGKCVLCNTCDLETSEHLFFSCSYAIRVWKGVEENMGLRLLCRGESVCQTWEASKTNCKTLSKGAWSSRFMSVIWGLWKQRNEVFRNKNLPPRLLAHRVIEEGSLWIKFCKGVVRKKGIG